MSQKTKFDSFEYSTLVDLYFNFGDLSESDIDEIILVFGLGDFMSLDKLMRRQFVHLILLIFVLMFYSVDDTDIPSCFDDFSEFFINIEYLC